MERGRMAVIGTGRMGLPLARRLLDRGYAVSAFNRTRERATPLEADGARVVAHPAEALQDTTGAIFVLSDAEAAEEVMNAPGMRAAMRGVTVIQMTTLGSQESIRLANRVTEAGGDYMEAPVMGGPGDAERGNLLILVGCAPQLLGRWQSLLEDLGRQIDWVGPVGKASVLKLCLNQFMGMMTATLSGSVNVLQAEGLDVDLLMGILRQFPYYAPTFDTKLPRMRDHDYSKPSFTCRLMMKDIRLAAEEARRNGVSNILLEGLTSLFREAVDRGYGDSDYSAVHEAVRRLDR